MIFRQFSGCDSVRDISNGMKSATGNLNHLGINCAPAKSTEAYQNASRDSSVFRDIFHSLFQHFGQQALWQPWQRIKFCFKMRPLLDYDGLLPEFVNITDGKTTDNKAAFDIESHSHSIVEADWDCCDCSLLNNWDSSNVSFAVQP